MCLVLVAPRLTQPRVVAASHKADDVVVLVVVILTEPHVIDELDVPSTLP